MAKGISNRLVKIPTAMQRTIYWSALALGIEGLFGVFTVHADVPIIVAAWTGMFVKLASQAGRKMDKTTATKVAAGIVVGVGGIASGMRLAETWLAYTGVGTLPAMICNAGTNAVFTYMVGCAIARVFLARDRNAPVATIVREVKKFLLMSLGHGVHRHA
ncbi:MAG: hypothetical protein WDN01_16895 [Rhizomicrobium sp.]